MIFLAFKSFLLNTALILRAGFCLSHNSEALVELIFNLAIPG
jgi:hypothetical protein